MDIGAGIFAVGTADLVTRSVEDASRGASAARLNGLIGPALARNAQTWAVLERLGVELGTVLPIAFCFESGGEAGDRSLADYLECELGLAVVVEPEGVSGWTPPAELRPELLDEWVETMIRAGFEHGGCLFAGWTVTVDRQSRR